MNLTTGTLMNVLFIIVEHEMRETQSVQEDISELHQLQQQVSLHFTSLVGRACAIKLWPYIIGPMRNPSVCKCYGVCGV